MKKSLFWLILLLCIGMLLPSCQPSSEDPKDTDPAGTETGTGSAGADADDDLERVCLVENGQLQVSFVYAHKQYWYGGLKKYVDNLNSTLQSKYEVTPEFVSSYDVTYDADRAEVLIGDTGLSESDQVLKMLRAGEWNITLCGKKLVIVGYDDDLTKSALYWFINNVVKKASGESLSFAETDCKTYSSVSYDADQILINGADLFDFKIVIPNSYDVVTYELAGELQRSLSKRYGYQLNVVRAAAKAERRLLLDASGEGLSAYEYEIRISGADLTLALGSAAILDQAVEGLTDLLCKEKSVRLTDTVLKTDLKDACAADGLIRQDGDIRVMFQNVYGWTSDEPHLDVRSKIDTLLYQIYDADIVCLQEMSAGIRAYLVPLLNKAGYTELDVNMPSDNKKNNYTPVFYRSDRFTVLDSGWILYEGLNDADSKSVSWGVFKEIKSGKSLAVCSTHFCWNDAATRNSNAQQLNTLFASLEAQNVPIVFGGDLNTVLDSEPIRILKNAGARHAWEQTTDRDSLHTNHAYPQYSATDPFFESYAACTDGYTGAIDHILTRGTLSVRQFRILHGSMAMKTSDHCPVYVDIILPD